MSSRILRVHSHCWHERRRGGSNLFLVPEHNLQCCPMQPLLDPSANLRSVLRFTKRNGGGGKHRRAAGIEQQDREVGNTRQEKKIMRKKAESNKGEPQQVKEGIEQDEHPCFSFYCISALATDRQKSKNKAEINTGKKMGDHLRTMSEKSEQRDGELHHVQPESNMISSEMMREIQIKLKELRNANNRRGNEEKKKNNGGHLEEQAGNDAEEEEEEEDHEDYLVYCFQTRIDVDSLLPNRHRLEYLPPLSRQHAASTSKGYISPSDTEKTKVRKGRTTTSRGSRRTCSLSSSSSPIGDAEGGNNGDDVSSFVIFPISTLCTTTADEETQNSARSRKEGVEENISIASAGAASAVSVFAQTENGHVRLDLQLPLGLLTESERERFHHLSLHKEEEKEKNKTPERQKMGKTSWYINSAVATSGTRASTGSTRISEGERRRRGRPKKKHEGGVIMRQGANEESLEVEQESSTTLENDKALYFSLLFPVSHLLILFRANSNNLQGDEAVDQQTRRGGGRNKKGNSILTATKNSNTTTNKKMWVVEPWEEMKAMMMKKDAGTHQVDHPDNKLSSARHIIPAKEREKKNAIVVANAPLFPSSSSSSSSLLRLSLFDVVKWHHSKQKDEKQKREEEEGCYHGCPAISFRLCLLERPCCPQIHPSSWSGLSSTIFTSYYFAPSDYTSALLRFLLLLQRDPQGKIVDEAQRPQLTSLPTVGDASVFLPSRWREATNLTLREHEEEIEQNIHSNITTKKAIKSSAATTFSPPVVVEEEEDIILCEGKRSAVQQFQNVRFSGAENFGKKREGKELGMETLVEENEGVEKKGVVRRPSSSQLAIIVLNKTEQDPPTPMISQKYQQEKQQVWKKQQGEQEPEKIQEKKTQNEPSEKNKIQEEEKGKILEKQKLQDDEAASSREEEDVEMNREKSIDTAMALSQPLPSSNAGTNPNAAILSTPVVRERGINHAEEGRGEQKSPQTRAPKEEAKKIAERGEEGIFLVASANESESKKTPSSSELTKRENKRRKSAKKKICGSSKKKKKIQSAEEKRGESEEREGSPSDLKNTEAEHKKGESQAGKIVVPRLLSFLSSSDEKTPSQKQIYKKFATKNNSVVIGQLSNLVKERNLSPITPPDKRIEEDKEEDKQNIEEKHDDKRGKEVRSNIAAPLPPLSSSSLPSVVDLVTPEIKAKGTANTDEIKSGKGRGSGSGQESQMMMMMMTSMTEDKQQGRTTISSVSLERRVLIVDSPNSLEGNLTNSSSEGRKAKSTTQKPCASSGASSFSGSLLLEEKTSRKRKRGVSRCNIEEMESCSTKNGRGKESSLEEEEERVIIAELKPPSGVQQQTQSNHQQQPVKTIFRRPTQQPSSDAIHQRPSLLPQSHEQEGQTNTKQHVTTASLEKSSKDVNIMTTNSTSSAFNNPRPVPMSLSSTSSSPSLSVYSISPKPSLLLNIGSREAQPIGHHTNGVTPMECWSETCTSTNAESQFSLMEPCQLDDALQTMELQRLHPTTNLPLHHHNSNSLAGNSIYSASAGGGNNPRRLLPLTPTVTNKRMEEDVENSNALQNNPSPSASSFKNGNHMVLISPVTSQQATSQRLKQIQDDNNHHIFPQYGNGNASITVGGTVVQQVPQPSSSSLVKGTLLSNVGDKIASHALNPENAISNKISQQELHPKRSLLLRPNTGTETTIEDFNGHSGGPAACGKKENNNNSNRQRFQSSSNKYLLRETTNVFLGTDPPSMVQKKDHQNGGKNSDSGNTATSHHAPPPKKTILTKKGGADNISAIVAGGRANNKNYGRMFSLRRGMDEDEEALILPSSANLQQQFAPHRSKLLGGTLHMNNTAGLLVSPKPMESQVVYFDHNGKI